MQKMQMQILHRFALPYYANADFATRLHYVYVYEFVYVYVYDLKRVAHKCARGRSRLPVKKHNRHLQKKFNFFYFHA